MKMKHSLVISCMVLAILPLKAQIEIEDLYGEWLTSNDDSAYYHTDTLQMFQSGNLPNESYACQYIKWVKGEKYFGVVNLAFCQVPPTQSAVRKEDAMRLKKMPLGQVIRITRKGKRMDEFKVLDYKEEGLNGKKVLSLMRVDEISEHRLYQYVQNLISTHFKGEDPKSEPVIILNGLILPNKEMLKEFRLAEASSITYLTKEKAKDLFDRAAAYGAILITFPNKLSKRG